MNMKKILIFGLLLLLCLTGCKQKLKAEDVKAPEFNSINSAYEVKRMYFDEKGNINFENAGTADEKGLHLYDDILTDEFLFRKNLYNYENLIDEKDIINSKGIIIFHNNIFAFFDSGEKLTLKLISDRSYRAYGTEYEFTEFIASAIDFYEGAYSGGDGLMSDRSAISGG